MPDNRQSVDREVASIRTPPHSLESEQCVIGGLLANNAAWSEVGDVVRAEDFYRGDHQLLFTTIGELIDAGKPADAITVFGELQRKGRTEDAGGFAYLNEIVDNVPSAANIRRYAEIVRDRSTLRQLAAAGEMISTRAYRPEGRQTSDVLDEAETAIFAIAENQEHIGAGFRPVKEIARDVISHVEMLNRGDGITFGIPTGLADLDSKLGGLQPGNLIVIAARPSMGKTALALNIGAHVAGKEKLPVAMFSMEMGAEELVQRMITSEGRIDAKRVRDGQLSDDEWARFVAAAHDVARFEFQIDATPGLSPSELRSRAKRLASRYGHLGMVIVDYLQLMHGSARAANENRATEVAEISRGLKALAKELNCPVVALSQLNRSVETRPDKRPLMSDLRESGSIEQDADVIIFIYRDERYNPDTEKKNVAELIVGKQRNGPIGTVEARFDGMYTRFDNLAKDGY